MEALAHDVVAAAGVDDVAPRSGVHPVVAGGRGEVVGVVAAHHGDQVPARAAREGVVTLAGGTPVREVEAYPGRAVGIGDGVGGTGGVRLVDEAGIHGVVAWTPLQGVAVEPEATVVADVHHFVGAAEELVVAGTAGEVVGPRAATDQVVATEPVDGVVAGQGGDDVAAGRAGQRVVAGGADDGRGPAVARRDGSRGSR